MSDGPLNPELHQRLREAFGHVTIACAGERATGRITEYCGKRQYDLSNGGEYYRVGCPWCGDTRQRLWIHHLWGVGVPDLPEDSFWWAAHCYNENCLSAPARLHDLRTRVWREIGRNARRCVPVREGRCMTLPTTDVEDPGVCTPVDQLAADHPAVRYLQSRGFDPHRLASDYQISFCERAMPRYMGAQGRIIAPVFMGATSVILTGRTRVHPSI